MLYILYRFCIHVLVAVWKVENCSIESRSGPIMPLLNEVIYSRSLTLDRPPHLPRQVVFDDKFKFDLLTVGLFAEKIWSLKIGGLLRQ